MPDMHHDPQHAAAPAAARSRHAAAWVIMLGAGATGMSYNLYLALHGDHIGNVILACLLGIMPMTLAMLLTHVVGDAAEEWMRWAALVIMVAAMYLSLSATAAVVEPGAGKVRAYVFGLLLDAAALLAFRVIVSARQRENAAAETVRAAEERAARARAEATAATARAEAAEARLEAAGSDLAEAEQARLEAASSAAAIAALEADLERYRAELERAQKALQKRAPGAGRKPARSVPERDESDVTLEFQALDILREEREVSGGELARRLGISPAYGRRLRSRIMATLEPSGEGAPVAPRDDAP